MEAYTPAEDSYLLEKHVRINVFGRVLDIGTGSGIQALTALKNHNAVEVIAVDINQKAIDSLNEKIKQNKLRRIRAVKSNLFENVSGKFNTIIFNPPYLPQDKGIEDQTIYGGRKGWEISERFFKEVSKYLAPDGKILFLFSTLTNKDKIEELIRNNLLEFKELDLQKISFETLYIYEITKTALLRELESRLIEEIHFFSKGKRGVIYTGVQDKSKLIKTHFPSKKELIKVAIKVKREDSEAINRIQNEADWLKVLNKNGIGPKFLFSSENNLVYQFVEGEFILNWIKKNNHPEIKAILGSILNQCYVLDQLGVNKEEMHHPNKHIIVTKENKIVLIDFERCSKTLKPKNVTQFLEFMCRIKEELGDKEVMIKSSDVRRIAKEYKKTYDKGLLENIFS